MNGRGEIGEAKRELMGIVTSAAGKSHDLPSPFLCHIFTPFLHDSPTF